MLMYLLPKPLPKSASHEPMKQTSAVANLLGNIYVYRAYEGVFFILSTSRGTALPFLGYEGYLTLSVADTFWCTLGCM